jgi:type IV secretion system protein VirB10
VLVVDLAEGAGGAAAAAPGQPAGTKADASAQPGAPAPAGLDRDEQFAARVEGAGEPPRSRATVLRARSSVIAQGAMIPGVLETALNSDLPGFARAIVSRDVRSFDGSTVLIPRGSRVIGEYRSAVAQGQSRAFVIWTRVLRPDGVSIQIGAILLSVISAGTQALVGAPSTEVVIGSSQAATGLATSASAFFPTQIPPTIKAPQGTPIRIFVGRDLDFGPAPAHGP